MSEQEVRDLLARAVPDAPEISAESAVAAGRRSRRRTRVVGAGLAVAAISAAAIVAPQLGGGSDETAPAAEETTVVDETKPLIDPWDAGPGCPRPVPEPGSADEISRETLRSATSVRLCVEPTDSRQQNPPQPSDLTSLSPRDGLVRDVADFASAVEELDTSDPARCAAIDYIARPLLLSVTADSSEGQTVSFVRVDFCTDVRVGGRTVAGEDLGEMFLEALAAQRESYRYRPDPGRLDPISCRTQTTMAPTKPGQGEIVDAIICPAYDSGTEATPVSEAGLERLRAAWDEAPGGVGPSECSDPDDNFEFVVVRTSLGDVEWLNDTDCGVVYMQSHVVGEHFEIATTLDDIR